MNWLNKLERRFGRYALRNLPLYIVVLYGFGAVMNFISDKFYVNFALNPYMVLHGEPWRVVTFLAVTSGTNIIFLIFILLLYYSIGESLVQVWGAFRFNMYVFCGVLGTLAAAFIVYAIYPSPYIFMDTYYVTLSLFLAYAAIFPDMQLYLYGILPIKIKWLALLDIVLLAFSFVQGGMGTRISIVVSLLNFILFYFSSRNYKKISPREVKRKRTYRKKVQKVEGTARHRCAVCGRTEEDDPDLEFRFCSKCNGNYEYCNEHLFTHTHVK
ncbi:MAG: hypothetical protein IJI25_03215 [Eubacterium sp.]|nr:hypothetical protein [Eubacterium sp.]